MGSTTCRTHLQNINQHLIKFESQPKQLEGNLIRGWFNVGENIFVEIYNLGRSVKWNTAAIDKNQQEVREIISQVTKNQDWLQSLITTYPGLRVDLEGVTPAVDVCRVRSGIEFLLQGFNKINNNFDNVLKNLKELGELEEFDDHLKVWKENHRPEFFPGDRPTDTPKSHWWWF